MDFSQLKFIPSSIPPLDALETFVPNGKENDPILVEAAKRTGMSRWIPTDGGHRVLILYEGGEYDHNRFTIVKSAWDHEHCKQCNCRIPSMTHCWVTEKGPWIILCDSCYTIITKNN